MANFTMFLLRNHASAIQAVRRPLNFIFINRNDFTMHILVGHHHDVLERARSKPVQRLKTGD